MRILSGSGGLDISYTICYADNDWMMLFSKGKMHEKSTEIDLTVKGTALKVLSSDN
jgi:hypothetical protein